MTPANRDACSKGGKTRAANLSPERRREIARLAVAARWHGAAWRKAAAVLRAKLAELPDAFFYLCQIDQMVEHIEKQERTRVSNKIPSDTPNLSESSNSTQYTQPPG